MIDALKDTPITRLAIEFVQWIEIATTMHGTSPEPQVLLETTVLVIAPLRGPAQNVTIARRIIMRPITALPAIRTRLATPTVGVLAMYLETATTMPGMFRGTLKMVVTAIAVLSGLILDAERAQRSSTKAPIAIDVHLITVGHFRIVLHSAETKLTVADELEMSAAFAEIVPAIVSING